MLRRRPDDAPTLTDRAAPLIEEAAERSRVSWRTRVERLRLAWRSIFQASVSAALAWLIATKVLGHPTPFFAPVSAIITLGITVGQRGQRAAEVALGVALGIADRRPAGDPDRHRHGPAGARRGAGHLGRDLPRQRADARHPGRGLGRAGGDAPAADRRRLVRPLPRRPRRRRRGADDQRAGAARPAAGPDAARLGAAAGRARGRARRRRGRGRAARPGARRPGARARAGRSTSCPTASARRST